MCWERKERGKYVNEVQGLTGEGLEMKISVYAWNGSMLEVGKKKKRKKELLRLAPEISGGGEGGGARMRVVG
jgi:hypothetical protein